MCVLGMPSTLAVNPSATCALGLPCIQEDNPSTEGWEDRALGGCSLGRALSLAAKRQVSAAPVRAL